MFCFPCSLSIHLLSKPRDLHHADAGPCPPSGVPPLLAPEFVFFYTCGGIVFVFDILYYYAFELYHRCCSHMCLFVTLVNTIDDYDNQDEEEEEDNEGYDLIII